MKSKIQLIIAFFGLASLFTFVISIIGCIWVESELSFNIMLTSIVVFVVCLIISD